VATRSRANGSGPIDLLKRYRSLCEARGLARANRVALAPSIEEELGRLEEQLRALLTVARSEADNASEPTEPPESPEPVAQAPPEVASPEEQPTEGRSDPVAAVVFTDGAAEGNPGPGGYCAIVRVPGRPDRELSGGTIHTTNNKMELTAAIVGLREALASGAGEVSVLSDSEYVVRGMTEWLRGWERKGWRTTTGQPVKNRELWEQLADLARDRAVRWQWIRGHAGHPENERCDRVATTRAREAASRH
jgi:ribonuclease HI